MRGFFFENIKHIKHVIIEIKIVYRLLLIKSCLSTIAGAVKESKYTLYHHLKLGTNLFLIRS